MTTNLVERKGVLRNWVESLSKRRESLSVNGVRVRRTKNIGACGVNCRVNHERSRVENAEWAILLPGSLQYLAFVVHKKQVRRLNKFEMQPLCEIPSDFDT